MSTLSETFSNFVISDVRFPTSHERDGSDAMNPDPDYSAAYVVVHTSDGNAGHGFVFTIGRGNEVAVAAIRAVESLVVGLTVDDVFSDMGAFYRRLTHDSQLRWLGPEKGVMHMAIGAVVNAVWDCYAKREGLPLWQLLSRFSPAEIVNLVDFRYLTDQLTPEEALAILERAVPEREARTRDLLDRGFPAYTTSAGWLGYSDEKVEMLVQQSLRNGFTHMKIKVGHDIDDDLRRVAMVREMVGPDIKLSIDANQTWDVNEAIVNVNRLAVHNIYWVEEPTSPDDILGFAEISRGVHPVKVATGEHVANRVMFKQFLASRSIDICQIDACRVAGVNENVATLLLAAKFKIPVCPHAGGVGLCEVVQHLSMFDYVAVSTVVENRWIEFVDHLHEHFVDPAQVTNGRYVAPRTPGTGAAMHADSVVDYEYPDGRIWKEIEGAG
ncbi:MAG: enolase C-terminal domain-like protein [Acidimicrobiales bacterium]